MCTTKYVLVMEKDGKIFVRNFSSSYKIFRKLIYRSIEYHYNRLQIERIKEENMNLAPLLSKENHLLSPAFLAKISLPFAQVLLVFTFNYYNMQISLIYGQKLKTCFILYVTSEPRQQAHNIFIQQDLLTSPD